MSELGVASHDRTTTAIVISLTAAAAVGLVAWQQWGSQAGKTVSGLLAEFRAALRIPKARMEQIRDEMLQQARQGLQTKGAGTLLMLPSMVDVLPTGHETGSFYAIDIGGTNFRVVLVKLADDKHAVEEVQMQECHIPEEMYKVPAAQLFDFMASTLVDFGSRHGLKKEDASKAALGFCFSFPVEQTALNAGRLVRLTKSFDNDGAVGQDPVKLLTDAFTRQGMPLRVSALLNDSVGTLAAARYHDPDAMIGVILGTGTNACYVEKVGAIGKLPKGASKRPHMIINTEWGNFRADCLPITDVDRELDATSPHRGEQPFEKLTAGMYMGEIARRFILRLVKEGGLFGGNTGSGLDVEWALTTPQMSIIDSDDSHDLADTGEVISESFGLDPTSHADRAAVREVCRLVAQRSEALNAAAIAALLRQLGRDGSGGGSSAQRTVVAVDGGVFGKYTKYREQLRAELATLLGKAAAGSVHLKHQADGSSMGAALLAAAAHHAD